jgi:hypothetical protein
VHLLSPQGRERRTFPRVVPRLSRREALATDHQMGPMPSNAPQGLTDLYQASPISGRGLAVVNERAADLDLSERIDGSLERVPGSQTRSHVHVRSSSPILNRFVLAAPTPSRDTFQSFTAH